MTNFQACKGCTRRHKNCHSSCIDYLTEKALNTIQKLERQKEKEIKKIRQESAERRVYKICGRKIGRNS